MTKDALSIRDLGEKDCWTLVQQAIGIPDVTMTSDFMTEKVCVLFFAQTSLPERLCVSAAVRQMGGQVVYECDTTGEHWLNEMHQHQPLLLPIFNFYLNCIYLYGISLANLKNQEVVNVNFPIINAGSPEAHPAHALADIAYMLQSSRYLNSFRCAWLGAPNGTLYSLIEASQWFPFSLRIAVPETSDTSMLMSSLEGAKNAQIVDSISDALIDAKFIFVGGRQGINYPLIKNWELNPSVFSRADPHFSFFLASRPVHALPIDQDLLLSKASLLVRQSEYRLRIHKRLLHYVFSD